jgi:hypothetical protein
LAVGAGRADAAAEVHHFNLVLSAIPTQIEGGDLNEEIQFRNRAYLEPRGMQGLETIGFAWDFDAEFRYLVRPYLALTAGAGQLRNVSKSEYLPALQEDIRLRAELLSVPVHLGAAYYFQPYNQGDFQARAYAGAGFLNLVGNRVKFQRSEVVADTAHSLRRWNEVTLKGESPGYYLEAGVHMFFAIRYSVLLGVVYRDAKISQMRDRLTEAPVLTSTRKPFELDASGVGARMAVAFGF